MRIGTWNVEYGVGEANPARLSILLSKMADIWILTETNTALDLGGAFTPVSSDLKHQPFKNSHWVTIWSRYPILRILNVPDPRRMVAAVFESPVGSLAVAGVVLPWHSDRGDLPSDPPPRNWVEHRRVIREEMPRLLSELQGQAPEVRRILAGDFNTDLAPPHSYGLKAERAELSRRLTESSLICHTASVLYPQPVPVRTLSDHICTSWGPVQSIETWSGTVDVGRRLSDHPGVVIQLPD